MESIQKAVKKHLIERGWHKLRPSDVAKGICIEAAELLELFQWSSMTIEEVKRDKEKLEALKKELADVMIYAFEMAVLLNLDSRKIIENKLAIIAKKYPAALMRKNRSRDPGTEDVYLKIKHEYRRKGL
jgi:dCTP diphosphatase